MSEKLKPCPHCGGTDLHVMEDFLTGGFWAKVICRNCSERDFRKALRESRDDAKSYAETKWNMRAKKDS